MSKCKANTTKPHVCFFFWLEKSPTSMEADIIADGFLQRETLLGLKFSKLIDSSVHRKLLQTMPYGPNLMVEKVECKNHVLCNYCHKPTDLSRIHSSRNLLKQQIPRFRTDVYKAMKYRAAGNEPLNTWICMLKADIENSLLHLFGDHEHCDGEINLVPELKSCGLLQEIMKIICGSVPMHVSSPIADQNNNLSELFNSIVNKHVVGMRINYALRGQYKMRCSAVVSFNNVG
ncbi:hypothetical protein PR048_019001 [Dryococelus australis]|uniref:Mutator-like transposase domain-containing protein n=1 Tax=Dryococelus australis TaxID=614101 RepID=A0ABQ9H2L3_9NEOP|nr:hypothetical protein PR048_019001 [Dryococelus australis]